MQQTADCLVLLYLVNTCGPQIANRLKNCPESGPVDEWTAVGHAHALAAGLPTAYCLKN